MSSYNKGILNKHHDVSTFPDLEKCAIYNQQPPQQHLLFDVSYEQKLFACTKHFKFLRFLEPKLQQCCPNETLCQKQGNVYFTPLISGTIGNLQEQKPPLLLDEHCPALSNGPEQHGTE